MIIKSNSIILAADSSPAFFKSGDGSEFKRGLYPLSFVQNLSFDVPNSRARMKQISSQSFAYDAIQFAPVINLSFNYISSTEFLNENFLGIFFKPSDSYGSVLNKANDFSCNLYFILSDDYPYDLIYKIKNQGNLNGLSSWSFGNCVLKNYSANLSAASLPQISVSLEAVNMQLQTITSDIVNCPAINLAVGDQSGIANIKINNSDFLYNLNTLNTSLTGQPILPTYDSRIFTLSNENIESPSIVISPYNNSAITSLNFSIDFERENSYGFNSNYVYDSKIKFPLLGTLDIEAIAFGLHTGNASLTGLMVSESGYKVEISASGEINTKTTTISGAKLQSNSYSLDLAGNLQAKFSFSFEANESQGLLHKWTQNINPSSGQLFTKDVLGMISSDGSGFKTSDDYYFQY